MIDGHVHVWSLDAARYPWHQTLSDVPIPTTEASAERLITEMNGAAVSHALLVQPSVYGWDNSYLCDSLGRHPGRFVGVCLVDPRSASSGDDLHYWCRERGCQGVRINLIGARDASWLLGSRHRSIWQAATELAVPVSLQLRVDQASTVVQLAEREAGVTFVADYLGPNAPRDPRSTQAVRALSVPANVYCKVLSVGQDSREPYPFRDLWPLYETAVEAFSPERLLFGTDFPHVTSICNYRQAIRWLAELPFLDNFGREAIAERTARRLWRFPDPNGGDS